MISRFFGGCRRHHGRRKKWLGLYRYYRALRQIKYTMIGSSRFVLFEKCALVLGSLVVGRSSVLRFSLLLGIGGLVPLHVDDAEVEFRDGDAATFHDRTRTPNGRIFTETIFSE